jgi:FkbM family methyltransferase
MKNMLQILHYIIRNNPWYAWPKRIVAAFGYQCTKRIKRNIASKSLFNGKHIFLFPDNPISSAFVYADIPDRKEIEALRALADSNTIFLDIGANIGAYSVMLMDKVKAVYAFEPHPVSAKYCKMNFLLNETCATKVVELAVSDVATTKYFSNLGGSHPMNGFVQSEENALSVKTTTLDDFARHHFTQTDNFILKIDVEGFEHEVFAGAQQFFKEFNIKGVIFETFSEKNTEIVQFLQSLGYQLLAMSANNILAKR